MKGAVLFSTRCMNMMLLKMFNWYIFKIFCSLKISLVCAHLFLLKIIRIRIACFCWLLIFLRFVLQVLPQAILACLCTFVYMSSRGLVRHSFLKKDIDIRDTNSYSDSFSLFQVITHSNLIFDNDS